MSECHVHAFALRASGRALDFDELERHDDEALRRAREAPGERREALRHLRLAAVLQQRLAPEVVSRAGGANSISMPHKWNS